MPIAAGLADTIAVGSVYEATDVPADRTALVLTPHVGPLPEALPGSAVLTVGSVSHVAALAGQRWRGAVVFKLASSMRRFGARPDELAALADAAEQAGLDVAG